MKHFLFVVILVITTKAFAQKIHVRDNASREGIPGLIISDQHNRISLTDNNGKADLSVLNRSDLLTFYHPAYTTFTLQLDDSIQAEVFVNAKTVMLDEVVLSANKVSEKKSDVPYTIEVIKQKDIEFANQPTSGEVVMNTGAVFVQKSQMGGSSPVLRGFEANRVLMVVDGVRMNNAIYRGGHLQDIITLDAQMLDRIEIVFGPSSTIYGSDALGGVMHFYTKAPQTSSNDSLLVKINAMTRFASVNTESTGHLDINFGWKNFASLTNITYSDFGDLRSGATKLPGYYKGWDRNYFVSRINNRDTMIANPDDNVQIVSAYHQMDIMQRFLYKAGTFSSHELNLQMSRSGEIPRYDRLTDVSAGKLRFAEWKYGPQQRLLGAYTFRNSKHTLIYDNLNVIAAVQRVDQDRITRSFQRTARTSQREDVTVYSFNADFFKKVNDHELRYGLESTHNTVESDADTTNIINGTSGKAITRYAGGGASMSSAAVYLSHAWEVNENFVISDGIRLTHSRLSAKFDDTTFYKFPFREAKQSFEAITGNIGFTWKESDQYKVALLFNSGFRAPNVDDLSKVFESAGNILIVPNTDIKPEYAYNMELNISKIFNKRFKFDVTGFYTSLVNALVLGNYKYNGSDSAVFNGMKSKVQAMQNADYAYIYGASFGFQFDFNENLSFKSIVTSTYGRYVSSKQDTVVPMDHIPPLFGQTNLLYRNKRTDAEFFVRFNGAKRTEDYSPSGEDNANYSADPLKGYMPAWFTLNLRAGYSFTNAFRVTAAIENITDNRYRVFASGINAPGRNFIVSLRYKI